jgi:hypothetical protein
MYDLTSPEPETEWHTIVEADQPTRPKRRWLIPGLAVAAVLACTAVGVVTTSHQPGVVAKLTHERQVHTEAVAKAKAAAKAAAWAHDMHNPTVLEDSVKESYEAEIATGDDPSGTIDDVTCLLISKANPNLFSCLITASSVYEDQVTATHEVLVSEDGTTWVAKS